MPQAAAGTRSRRADASAGTRYRYRIEGELMCPIRLRASIPTMCMARAWSSIRRAFAWTMTHGADVRGARRPRTSSTSAHSRTRALSRCGRHLDYLADLGVTAIELMPLAISRASATGATTACCPSRRDAATARPTTCDRAGRRRARARSHGADGRRVQPLRPGRQLPPPHRAAVLHRPPQDAVGRRDQFRRQREQAGARILRAQRALLDRGVSRRRVAARRRARHRRRFLARFPDRARAPRARGPGREREIHLVLENDRNDAHRLARNDDADAPVLHRPVERRLPPCGAPPAHRRASRLLRGLCATPARVAGSMPRRRLRVPGRSVAVSQARARAASRARIFRPMRSSTSCRTTTRSAIAPSASGCSACAALPRAQLPPIFLLAPSMPLLFMGEEFAADSTVPVLRRLRGDLATAVRDGRRAEFAGFPPFDDEARANSIPDPGAEIDGRPEPAALGLHRARAACDVASALSRAACDSRGSALFRSSTRSSLARRNITPASRRSTYVAHARWTRVAPCRATDAGCAAGPRPGRRDLEIAAGRRVDRALVGWP